MALLYELPIELLAYITSYLEVNEIVALCCIDQIRMKSRLIRGGVTEFRARSLFDASAVPQFPNLVWEFSTLTCLEIWTNNASLRNPLPIGALTCLPKTLKRLAFDFAEALPIWLDLDPDFQGDYLSSSPFKPIYIDSLLPNLEFLLLGSEFWRSYDIRPRISNFPLPTTTPPSPINLNDCYLHTELRYPFKNLIPSPKMEKISEWSSFVDSVRWTEEMKAQFLFHLPRTLKSLYLGTIPEINRKDIKYDHLLKDLQNFEWNNECDLLPPNLTSLSVTYGLVASRLPKSLYQSLSDLTMQLDSNHADTSLPPLLKTLEGSTIYDSSTEYLPISFGSLLPIGLTDLTLGFSWNIDSYEQLPPTLTNIPCQISSQNIPHAIKLFPNIKSISILCEPKELSLLPKNLTSCNISLKNRLESVHIEVLPATITLLDLFGPFVLDSECASKLPPNLQTLILYQNSSCENMNAIIKLPRTLTELQMVGQNFEDDWISCLPPVLTSLILHGPTKCSDACIKLLPRNLSLISLYITIRGYSIPQELTEFCDTIITDSIVAQLPIRVKKNKFDFSNHLGGFGLSFPPPNNIILPKSITSVHSAQHDLAHFLQNTETRLVFSSLKKLVLLTENSLSFDSMPMESLESLEMPKAKNFRFDANGFPSNITSLSLLSDHWDKKIPLPSKIIELRIESIDSSRLEGLQYLLCLETASVTKLQHLPKSLTKLKLSCQLVSEDQIIHLPTHLTSLSLPKTNWTDKAACELPEMVSQLELASLLLVTDIYYNQVEADISTFRSPSDYLPRLQKYMSSIGKHVGWCDKFVGKITFQLSAKFDLEFASTLTSLVVENHPNFDANCIERLPRSITCLELHLTLSQPLIVASLPPSLRRLTINSSGYYPVEFLHIPEGLESLELNCAKAEFKSLQRWPDSLKLLRLEGSYSGFKLEDISQGIEHLVLPSTWYISELGRLPPGLTHLEASNPHSRDCIDKLPRSLKFLNMRSEVSNRKLMPQLRWRNSGKPPEDFVKFNSQHTANYQSLSW